MPYRMWVINCWCCGAIGEGKLEKDFFYYLPFHSSCKLLLYISPSFGNMIYISHDSCLKPNQKSYIMPAMTVENIHGELLDPEEIPPAIKNLCTETAICEKKSTTED